MSFRTMLRSVTTSLKTTWKKRQFSDRNLKVYKFLALPNQKIIRAKEQSLPPPTKLDEATAEVLEKISLVGIQSETVIQILEEAIRFADQILAVNTTNVKPLVTVLENESLSLREDTPKTDVTKNELISHCKVSQENYFVTPIGNIEYSPEEKPFLSQNSKQICKN